jgi:hypothetical protein
MEGTVEMSSEEYEAARILLSLKYSGDSNTGPQKWTIKVINIVERKYVFEIFLHFLTFFKKLIELCIE